MQELLTWIITRKTDLYKEAALRGLPLRVMAILFFRFCLTLFSYVSIMNRCFLCKKGKQSQFYFKGLMQAFSVLAGSIYIFIFFILL